MDNTPNPNAVALGKLGKGYKKSMTPAAWKQRRDAAKAQSDAAKASKKQLK